MQDFVSDILPGRDLVSRTGEKYLWFGGTDYLGMAHHAELRSYFQEGLDKYGLHFGSSRNNIVQLQVYDETERHLARFFGGPAALTLSSGMWAGQLLTRVLPEFFQQVYGTETIHWHLAPGTHPALWAQKPTAGSQNFETWLKNLAAIISSGSGTEAHIICADAVGSPEVRSLNLESFKILSSLRTPIGLVIDDSHSIGALHDGKGSYQALSGFEGIRTIVTSSLNKAMGIPGGLLIGDTELITFVRKSPWFGGASPIAPAYMHALGKGLEKGLFPEALIRLKDNNRKFTPYAEASGLFQSIENYPVYSSRADGLYDFLLDRRILAPSFPYPTPTDTPVLRLVISALHTSDDIHQLICACREFEEHM